MNGNGDKFEFHGFEKGDSRFVKWLDNFWYHYKWHTVIGAFFAIVIGICSYQYITREVPDVYIMYAGPEYISSGGVTRLKSALRGCMDDYNGDGEKGMMLVTLTCMSEEKIAEREEEAEAASEEFYIDIGANADNIKQFDMEIFAGEAVICLLDPSLYERVRDEGGFMKITDVLGEEKLDALLADGTELYDECGVLLSSTKFGKYHTPMAELPDDTVLCVRKISTISVFKGKKKYEKLHGYHVDMFGQMLGFEYPEGYEPDEPNAE